MNNSFQELTDEQFARALEEFLLPRIRQIITLREPGHCMRVTDLERPLTIGLAAQLRAEKLNALVYILGEPGSQSELGDLFITSTKLVELRNPLAGGQLRAPLLIFIPPNLRSSVEDSISIATFEDIGMSDIYGELIKAKLAELPVEFRGLIRELFTWLPKQQWRWSDPVAQARFLLTAVNNGKDAESVGASLYELGLVPDFHLLNDLARTPVRWQQNLAAMKNITYSDLSIRGRVANLGITDKEVQRHLTSFLLEAGGDDPTWTRRIALERSHSKTISWDKWKLKSTISTEQIAITEVETDLHQVAEEKAIGALQGLVGELYLDPASTTKLKAGFSVDPAPAQVEGLDHFTVQLVAENGGPVGIAKNVKVGARNRAKFSVTLDKLNQIEFEEGWHFIRVLPWTKENDPITLTKTDNNLGQNQSELFYVVTGSDAEEEAPQQRAVPREVSLEHARLHVQFSKQQYEPELLQIQSVSWMDKSTDSRSSTQNTLEIRFGRLGTYRIPVARQLQEIERRILTYADPVSWKLTIRAGKLVEVKADGIEWQLSSAFESFIAARRKYFDTLSDGANELITQGAQLLNLESVCSEYAESYRDLLRDLQNKIERSEGAERHRDILMLRSVLAVDVVRISAVDFTGRSREAALLGPTHPLRALWLVAWAKLGQHWLAQAKQCADEFLTPTRDAILREITLLNLPAHLPLPDGRVFVCVDNIHPFWSLYAASQESDPRGLLSEVCACLGLEEPAIGGAVVTKEILSGRIERYISQHPYVRTLIINAFNPGSGNVLAEAIEELSRKPSFASLRFDIRLFVPDPESPNAGQALEDLLALNGEENDENAEATTFITNPLFPKLTLAIHSNDDFQRDPRYYRAHISLLFDLFPASEISGGEPLQVTGQSPLHGLIQDFITKYQDDESSQFWRKQPLHGLAQPLPGADYLTDLLSELPRLISGATTTAAAGLPVFDQRPIITLNLGSKQRKLLFDIHEVSDWVFTIDRNLGIEFFDHGKPGERPDYLIDYVPGSSASQGHRLIITSRSLAEIQAMLQPVLARHRLPTAPEHAALILEQLRALSGQLALKLISSPNHQKEALGLALARLFLKYQGALSNQIVVPLDAHLDLFRSAKRHADEAGQEGTLQRTDLAFFDLNAEERTISCRLVEVKCHDHGSSLGAYAQLKQTVAAQLGQSEKVLRYHFDSHLKDSDRPDRLLKTRELGTLLRHYLERSIRYRLIEESAGDEARRVLDSLEDGYQLKFIRSALIFDFEKNGTEESEQENGIEFYRIGKNLIGLLVAQASGSATEEELSVSIPKLTTAAFIAPPRDRTSHALRDGKPLSPVDEIVTPAVSLPVFEEDISVVSKDTPPGTTAIVRQDHDSSLKTIEPSVIESIKNQRLLDYDVMLGVTGDSPQYGLLGEINGRKIALDLNQTHTISLFGVQGGGKSYTLGSIIEMACAPIQNINVLPKRLSTVVFHYSPTLDYKPEFISMIHPNDVAEQLRGLRDRYDAAPQALSDVVILTPAPKVAERQAEYPGIEVLPISFAASELKAPHWRFLMGAVGSQSMYLRQINLLMRGLRDNLTLGGLYQALDQSSISDHLKDLARTRLNFAAEYIDDTRRLAEVIRPGRLIIVDLRDEFIEKDEALGLFVVMLQIFSEATHNDQSFNKLVVFDEAHKYIENQDLVSGLIEVVREMRHKGTSILVASQDPPSVPTSLIELSSQIILHKFNSPAWLKHIQKANSSLEGLTPKQMSDLISGEAFIWSSKASDELLAKGAVKIKCRPRVTMHGGGTKTAV